MQVRNGSAKQVLSALLGICIAAVFTRQVVAHFDFIIDDTFISLVYAKNLINGAGITFNGEYVAGYSNFLWVIALSLLGFLGVDLVLAAKILGIVCAYGTLALLVLISRQVLQNLWPGLIAGLLLSVSSSYVVWSVAGLETLGFSLLLVTSIYLIVREEQRGVIRWSPAPLTALALMRPEGIGLVVALAGMRLASRLLYSRSSILTRNYFLGNALIFICYAGYIAWHTYYYGYPFPTTVYAKQATLESRSKMA